MPFPSSSVLLSSSPPSNGNIAINAVMLIVAGVVCSLIADRKPGNPIGWTFMGVFLFSMISQFQSIAIDFILAGFGDPSSAPITTLAFINVFLDRVLSVTTCFSLLTNPVYHFPTGRLPSTRWEWVTRPVFAVLIVWTILGAFRSDLTSTIIADYQNPLALPFANSLNSIFEAIMVLGNVIAPFSFLVRSLR